jgi:hypothetical protein
VTRRDVTYRFAPKTDSQGRITNKIQKAKITTPMPAMHPSVAISSTPRTILGYGFTEHFRNAQNS